MHENRACHGDFGNYGELFRIVYSFKKLNISAMLPDVTLMEIRILDMIVRCRDSREGTDVKVSDLVNHMKVTAPAVSRSLRKMEEKGYLLRSVDKNDRRNTHLELTERGEAVLKESGAIMHEFAEAILAGMSEEHMSRLIADLKALQSIAADEIEKRKYKGRKD